MIKTTFRSDILNDLDKILDAAEEGATVIAHDDKPLAVLIGYRRWKIILSDLDRLHDAEDLASDYARENKRLQRTIKADHQLADIRAGNYVELEFLAEKLGLSGDRIDTIAFHVFEKNEVTAIMIDQQTWRYLLYAFEQAKAAGLLKDGPTL